MEVIRHPNPDPAQSIQVSRNPDLTSLPVFFRNFLSENEMAESLRLIIRQAKQVIQTKSLSKVILYIHDCFDLTCTDSWPRFERGDKNKLVKSGQSNPHVMWVRHFFKVLQESSFIEGRRAGNLDQTIPNLGFRAERAVSFDQM